MVLARMVLIMVVVRMVECNNIVMVDNGSGKNNGTCKDNDINDGRFKNGNRLDNRVNGCSNGSAKNGSTNGNGR